MTEACVCVCVRARARARAYKGLEERERACVDVSTGSSATWHVRLCVVSIRSKVEGNPRDIVYWIYYIDTGIMILILYTETHPNETSARASASGLPHSLVMMTAMSSAFSRIRRCHLGCEWVCDRWNDAIIMGMRV